MAVTEGLSFMLEYPQREGDRKQANCSAFYDPRSDILSFLLYFGHTDQSWYCVGGGYLRV